MLSATTRSLHDSWEVLQKKIEVFLRIHVSYVANLSIFSAKTNVTPSTTCKSFFFLDHEYLHLCLVF